MSETAVLVCGRLPAGGREALESACIRVDHQPDRKSGSLADVIEPFAGVIVHSPHLVDAAAIEAGRNLRVVGRAGVGVDNVDVEAATGRGVLVMNMPWGNTVSAAEHTVGLMLALARNVPQAAASLAAGSWDRKSHLGVELHGKQLGIIGLGRIGREVARRARGFGMEVLGSDPFLPVSAAEQLEIRLVSVAELLPEVDFVTVHVPLTPDTHHLIDTEALAQMRPGVRIVNCARGGLVDEDALLAALESGKVAGAACDVFEVEPTDNAALLAHSGFIGTPHLGGATREARERIGVEIARQVADYLSQGAIRNAINVDALPPEQQRVMGPYLDLGRALGSLMSQCWGGGQSLRVHYHGEITELTPKAVTAWILAGFLRPFLGDEVNVVNAPAMADERGLAIEEHSRPGDGGYSSLIRVEVVTGEKVHSAAGTVFDGKQGRLVEFEGLPIEITPTGHLLVFANEDTPGVIGQVGTFLAERGINIADMRVGRTAPRGEAIAAATIDEPLDAAGLRELLAIANIRWARIVEF